MRIGLLVALERLAIARGYKNPRAIIHFRRLVKS